MKRRRGILLMCDFDGTLAPIAPTPAKALLPQRVRAWLRGLAGGRGVTVAIVTGRALPDIRNKVKLRSVIYAANHGMEIACHGRMLLRKGEAYRKPLSRIARRLQSALAGIPGALVDPKGLSVAVHLRRVPPRRQGEVRRRIRQIAGPFLEEDGLRLTGGKKIVEVRPAACWDKGEAALWIWRRCAPGSIPVYIGDDATDEDAFRALRRHGVTIRIGQRRGSAAQYAAASIGAVIDSGIFPRP